MPISAQRKEEPESLARLLPACLAGTTPAIPRQAAPGSGWRGKSRRHASTFLRQVEEGLPPGTGLRQASSWTETSCRLPSMVSARRLTFESGAGSAVPGASGAFAGAAATGAAAGAAALLSRAL
jgi:hypothetical protein